MAELSMTTSWEVSRCRIERSDGERFALIGENDGSAVLHATDNAGHSRRVIVNFDVNVADKVEASRRYVLAFPNLPDGVPTA